MQYIISRSKDGWPVEYLANTGRFSVYINRAMPMPVEIGVCTFLAMEANSPTYRYTLIPSRSFTPLDDVERTAILRSVAQKFQYCVRVKHLTLSDIDITSNDVDGISALSFTLICPEQLTVHAWLAVKLDMQGIATCRDDWRDMDYFSPEYRDCLFQLANLDVNTFVEAALPL